ncbi:MAG: hypothetical protein JSV39_03190, partial [Candidatus Aenigmatarchaeota archaeon]
MLKFLRDRKVGKAKKDYFHELSIIAREEREKILKERIREIVSEELKNSGINKRVDDISQSLKNTDKKLEDLKSSLVP